MSSFPKYRAKIKAKIPTQRMAASALYRNPEAEHVIGCFKLGFSSSREGPSRFASDGFIPSRPWDMGHVGHAALNGVFHGPIRLESGAVVPFRTGPSRLVGLTASPRSPRLAAARHR